MSIPIRAIQQAVCEHYGLAREELLGSCRDRRIAWPRQVGYWLAHQLTDRSYPEIARMFARLDHTTVLAGRRAVSMRTKRDMGERVAVWQLYRGLIEAHG